MGFVELHKTFRHGNFSFKYSEAEAFQWDSVIGFFRVFFSREQTQFDIPFPTPLDGTFSQVSTRQRATSPLERCLQATSAVSTSMLFPISIAFKKVVATFKVSLVNSPKNYNDDDEVDVSMFS